MNIAILAHQVTPAAPPPDRPRFMRLPQVMASTGLSKSGIYKYIKQGQFPRPVPLGGHYVAWLSSEIDAWMQSRISERNEA